MLSLRPTPGYVHRKPCLKNTTTNKQNPRCPTGGKKIQRLSVKAVKYTLSEMLRLWPEVFQISIVLLKFLEHVHTYKGNPEEPNLNTNSFVSYVPFSIHNLIHKIS